MGNIAAKPKTSPRGGLKAYLDRVGALPAVRSDGDRGRLIFALDATGSREAAWNEARRLQTDMFREVATIGGLDLQLVYFRGDECKASKWINNHQRLGDLMMGINCEMGATQIGKVLDHARKENQRHKVGALVFVGDAMEENPDALAVAAAALGIPTFIFQEGDDPECEKVFREIAQLTGGAYCRFEAGAAGELGELLRAAATYAAGGKDALSALHTTAATKLIGQIKG